MSNGSQNALELLKRMQRRKEANKIQRQKYKGMHRTAYYGHSEHLRSIREKNISAEKLEEIKVSIRLKMRKERAKNQVLSILLFGVLILLIFYFWS